MKAKETNPSCGMSSIVTPYVPSQRVVKPRCQCASQTAPCHAGGINTPRLSSDVSPTSVLSDVERKLVDHEIEVCTCAADRYPNNYNAWSHRSWLIQQFAAGDIQVHCYLLLSFFSLTSLVRQASILVLDLFSFSFRH